MEHDNRSTLFDSNPLDSADCLDLAASAAAASGGPSLDSQETSGLSTDWNSYRAFAASGMKGTVSHIESAYRRSDEMTHDHRVINYVQCRSQAWFLRHKDTGEVRVASAKCGLRWCPFCSQTRRFTIQKSVGEWLKTIERPKFITLTLKHSTAPLKEQIKALYDNFRKLRKGKLWKKSVFGGIWFFQIKKSKTDGLWHPHLHILVVSKFILQADLSKAWASVSHGSKIVDIRQVKDPKKAADYVARYAAAPSYLPELSIEDAATVIIACHGQRIVGTFGTGKNIKLLAKPLEDADKWEKIADWRQMMYVRHSDPISAEIYAAWSGGKPYFGPSALPPPVVWADKIEIETEVLTYKQMVFAWSNSL